MKVSQAIRSIKTDTKSWYVASDNDQRIVLSNGHGYYFVRYSNFEGFKICSPEYKVEMNYKETDMIAQQLWLKLVSIVAGL